MRLPLIVRGPKVDQGRISSEPEYAPDLYPTLLRAAGFSDQAKASLDGTDFTPLLGNPDFSLPREALYFHYPHYYQTTTPVSAIRKGNWKLLEYFEDGRMELFNLKQDPGETRNLSTTRSALAKELRADLDAWRKKVEAQLPEVNPGWKPRRK